MKTPVALLVLCLCALAPLPAQAAATDTHLEGHLSSGAAYVMDVPAGWNGAVLLYSHGYIPAGAPNPAQQANQYTAVAGLLQTSAFGWRQEAETRAGGNMSWNTGVDYTAMLHNSPQFKEVAALYKKAGLSLGTDLAALGSAPRISADPDAVRWMTDTSVFTGQLTDPQLDIHTTKDPLIPVQAESAYRQTAAAGGSGALLSQAYVDSPGHCTFTTGEMIGALDTLEHRLDTGHWDTSPATLNSRAQQEDPTSTPRYVAYRPSSYPRPYDLAHPNGTHS